MRPRTFLLLLAAAMTAAAITEPLTVGDLGAGAFALPLLPAGLEVLWDRAGLPVWARKASLFPLHWLFVRSLFTLFQRFATKYRRLLVAGIVLSPVLLPRLDLSFEVPAYGLVLAAVAQLVTAIDRNDPRRAALAAALAALAGQSAYRGLVAIPLLAVYARVQGRRPEWGDRAATVGALAFLALEALRWQLFGGAALAEAILGAPGVARSSTWSALPFHLGGTLGWAALLVAAVLPASTLWVGLGATGFVGGIALLASRPLEPVVFGIEALGWAVATAFAIHLVARGQPELREVGQARILRFLVAWFSLEVVAALAEPPTGSSPHTIGLAVVSLLLLGRSLTMSRRRPADLAVRIATGLGIALGVFVYGLGLYEGVIVRSAAELSTKRVLHRVSSEQGWFIAEGDLALHVERGGLQPLERGELVGAGERIAREGGLAPSILEDADALRFAGDTVWDDPIPYTTRPGTHYPIAHRSSPRLVVELWQAEREYAP